PPLPRAPLSIFSCHRAPAPRALPSFPTRRSSDLLADVRVHDERGEEVAFMVDSGSRAWPRDGALPSSPVTLLAVERRIEEGDSLDRKSTRLNSSHVKISYAVFCLKKKKYSR